MVTTRIRNKTSILIFFISIIVFTFYLFGYIVIGNVYRFSVVGAIYELLWFPMLASLLLVPLISVIVLVKNKGKGKVYAALSVILIISSIIILATH